MIVTDFPSARDRLDSQRSANRLFRSVVEIVGLPTTGCWLWSSVSSIARPQYRARLDTRTTHRQYRSFPRGLKTTDYVNSRRVHSTHEFRLAPSRLSASSSDAALPTDDRTMILAWRITVIRSSTGTRLLPIASKCPPIVCDLRPARFPLRAIVPEAIRSSRLARHRYLLDDYTGRDLAPSKSFDSSRCATRGDRVTSWGPTKLNEKISCRRHDSRGRNFTSSMLEDSKSDCVSFFKRVYFGLIRVTRLMQKKSVRTSTSLSSDCVSHYWVCVKLVIFSLLWLTFLSSMVHVATFRNVIDITDDPDRLWIAIKFVANLAVA